MRSSPTSTVRESAPIEAPTCMHASRTTRRRSVSCPAAFRTKQHTEHLLEQSKDRTISRVKQLCAALVRLPHDCRANICNGRQAVQGSRTKRWQLHRSEILTGFTTMTSCALTVTAWWFKHMGRVLVSLVLVAGGRGCEGTPASSFCSVSSTEIMIAVRSEVACVIASSCRD